MLKVTIDAATGDHQIEEIPLPATDSTIDRPGCVSCGELCTAATDQPIGDPACACSLCMGQNICAACLRNLPYDPVHDFDGME